MRLRLSIVASLLALGGCQTTEQYEATRSAEVAGELASFRGRTVADFIAEQSEFTPVRAVDTAGGRDFFFETDPVVVTTTTPGFIPSTRTYNDASIGAEFNNLNAALYSTPAVSQSRVQVCRVTLVTERIADADSPRSWRIVGAQHSGERC